VFHQQAVDEDISATDAAQEDQVNAVVAMFERFRVAFEDVDYFLEEGCVIVPNDDNAVHNVSADGDALVFRGSRSLFISHVDFRGEFPTVCLLYDLFLLPIP
jgi:hypothetical protein